MANELIKLAAAGRGVKLWQVANELGMADSNFSRKLRIELSDAEREIIMQIIDRLSKERSNEAEN